MYQPHQYHSAHNLSQQFQWEEKFPELKNRDLTRLRSSVEGQKPNLVDREQQSLLHIAAIYDNVELATFLYSPDLNAVNQWGNTPLHIAVYYNSLALVNWLLEKEALITVLNTEKFSPLSLAAKLGNQPIFSALINSNMARSDDDINYTLYYAAYYAPEGDGNQPIIAELLQRHKAKLTYTLQPHKLDTMEYLRKGKKISQIHLLMPTYQQELRDICSTLNNDTAAKYILLQEAILNDNKIRVAVLIFIGVSLLPDSLQNVPISIQRFLNYYPGLTTKGYNTRRALYSSDPPTVMKEKMRSHDLTERYPSIYEYITDSQNQTHILGSLADLILDEANTSDEESSDEEEDNFTVVNENYFTNTFPIGDYYSKPFFRGVHFSKSHFNSQDRIKYKKKQAHEKVYSPYTQKMAWLMSEPESLPDDNCYLFADRLVKNWLNEMKRTPKKTELEENGKIIPRQKDGRPAYFENMFLNFLQAFVNNYKTLIFGGGITRNFNAMCNANPLISMIDDLSIALKYAINFYQLNPQDEEQKIRQSTKRRKHRRVGYVEMYAFLNNYFNQYVTHIDSQDIGVAARRHKDEYVVHSSIPPGSVVGYRIFSLPKNIPNRQESVQEYHNANEGAWKSRFLQQSARPAPQFPIRNTNRENNIVEALTEQFQNSI